MASIYRKGNVWWIKFYLDGQSTQQSLQTSNKRVALYKKRQLEYQLATQGMVLPSRTPLQGFLEEFCNYLAGIRTPKSYKNDVSCLRTFFGPICSSLPLQT